MIIPRRLLLVLQVLQLIALAICLLLIPLWHCSLLQAVRLPITADWWFRHLHWLTRLLPGLARELVTRTYSIADSCNNISSCSQAFTVSDNNPPAITCPAGTTVQIASVICLPLILHWHCSLLPVETLPITADWWFLHSHWLTRLLQVLARELVTRTYSIADSCG